MNLMNEPSLDGKQLEPSIMKLTNKILNILFSEMNEVKELRIMNFIKFAL